MRNAMIRATAPIASAIATPANTRREAPSTPIHASERGSEALSHSTDCTVELFRRWDPRGADNVFDEGDILYARDCSRSRCQIDDVTPSDVVHRRRLGHLLPRDSGWTGPCLSDGNAPRVVVRGSAKVASVCHFVIARSRSRYPLTPLVGERRPRRSRQSSRP